MKKSFFAFIFALLMVLPVFSSAHAATLKELAVGKIFQYARSQYDRGNYEEAAKAFNHILDMDPNHAQAKTYMRKLGLSRHTIERSTQTEPLPSEDFSGSNADIKAKIAREEEAIELLNQEMPPLRSSVEMNAQ